MKAKKIIFLSLVVSSFPSVALAEQAWDRNACNQLRTFLELDYNEDGIRNRRESADQSFKNEYEKVQVRHQDFTQSADRTAKILNQIATIYKDRGLKILLQNLQEGSYSDDRFIKHASRVINKELTEADQKNQINLNSVVTYKNMTNDQSNPVDVQETVSVRVAKNLGKTDQLLSRFRSNDFNVEVCTVRKEVGSAKTPNRSCVLLNLAEIKDQIDKNTYRPFAAADVLTRVWGNNFSYPQKDTSIPTLSEYLAKSKPECRQYFTLNKTGQSKGVRVEQQLAGQLEKPALDVGAGLERGEESASRSNALRAI